jgi:mono/diheme cytochrome c family protein
MLLDGWGFVENVSPCGEHSPGNFNRPPIFMTKTTSLAVLTALFSLSAASAEDKVNYESQVLPIFKERCFECHQKEFTDENGRVKRPKGKFRMDNPELMLKGGSEGGDLTPGDPDKSTVYTYTLLPDDDDMAMPPKGPRLTDAEKELIRKWIAQGADFGGWKGAEE